MRGGAIEFKGKLLGKWASFYYMFKFNSDDKTLELRSDKSNENSIFYSSSVVSGTAGSIFANETAGVLKAKKMKIEKGFGHFGTEDKVSITGIMIENDDVRPLSKYPENKEVTFKILTKANGTMEELQKEIGNN